jgi:hypothetical protein
MSLAHQVSDSLGIRPTENYAENQFWVTVTGRDVDFHTLSTDKEAFVNYFRKMSGLHTLEFGEFLTHTDFK